MEDLQLQVLTDSSVPPTAGGPAGRWPRDPSSAGAAGGDRNAVVFVSTNDGLPPNSFLFLVARPGAPSSVLAPFVAMPFVTSSFFVSTNDGLPRNSKLYDPLLDWAVLYRICA